MIREVYLTQLQGTNNSFSNAVITDRYGVDETLLWKPVIGGPEIGWRGYVEWDSTGVCPGAIGVVWGSDSGIYDERCLYDPTCDAMRLQTEIPAPHKISVFNYLLGPLTFTFDIALSSPPRAVRLVMGHNGGNGGDPAVRYAALPDEEFVIQVP